MTPVDPSTGLVVGSLALGLVAAVFWPVTTHLLTLAHEGSHGLFGALGGSVGRITVVMSAKGGGGTPVQAPWLTSLVAGLFGYLGPSVFGLLGAVMLANGLAPTVVIWVSVAFMAAILLKLGNPFGFVAVLIAGGLFGLVAWEGTETGKTVFAYTWVWFLLIGGFADTLVLQALRSEIAGRGKKDTTTDAAILRTITKLPAAMWVGFWSLVTLAALVYGGGLLLGAIEPPLSSA